MQAFRSSPRHRQEHEPFSSSEMRRRNHKDNEDAMYDYRTPNQRKSKHKNKYSNKRNNNNNKLDSDVEEEMIAQQLLYASDVDRAVDEIEHDDMINKYIDDSDNVNMNNNKSKYINNEREWQGRSALRNKRENGKVLQKINGASIANNVSRESNYSKVNPFRSTQPTRPWQSWEDDHDDSNRGERVHLKNSNNNYYNTHNVNRNVNNVENMYNPTHKLSERAANILSNNAHSATQPFSSAVSYASGQSNYVADNHKYSNNNNLSNTSFRSHVSPTEERIITEWMKHNNNSSNHNNKRQIVSPAPAAPLLSPTESSFTQRRFSQTKLISPRSDFIRLETDNHYIHEPYYSTYKYGNNNEDPNTSNTQSYIHRLGQPLSPVPNAADEVEMIEDAAHARVARQLQLLQNKQRLDELDESRRNRFSKHNSFVSSHTNDNDIKKKIMSPVHVRSWEGKPFPVKELVEAQVKQLQQLPMRENSPITVNNNYYFDTHTDNNNVSDNEMKHHTPNKLRPYRSADERPAGNSNYARKGKQLLSPRVSAAGLQTYSSVDSFESTSEEHEWEQEEEERKRQHENYLSPEPSSSSRNSTAVVVEYSNDREWSSVVGHDNVLYHNTHNEPKLSPRYDVVDEVHEMHHSASLPHSQSNRNNNTTSSRTRYSPPRNTNQRHRRKKNDGHNTKPKRRGINNYNNDSKKHNTKSSGFLEIELKKLSHAMSADRANEYAHTPTATTEEAGSSSSSFEEHKKRNSRKRNHNNNNKYKYNDQGEDEDDEDYFSSAKSEESSLSSANNTSGHNNMYKNNNRSNNGFHNKRSTKYRSNSHDPYYHAAGHSTSERINHNALMERETWEDAYQQETNTFPQTWSSASAVPPPRIIEHEQHRRNNFNNTNAAITNNNNNNINNNYETKNTNNIIKENNNIMTNSNNDDGAKDNENKDDVYVGKKGKENQLNAENDHEKNNVDSSNIKNNNYAGQLPHSRALYTPSTVDSELNGLKNNSSRSSSPHHYRNPAAERKNSIPSKNNIMSNNNNDCDGQVDKDDASHGSKPKHFHSLSSPKMDEGKDDNHFSAAASKSGSSRRNSLTSDARNNNNNKNAHVHNDSETHHNAEISYSHEGVDDDTPGNPQLQTSKPNSRGKVKGGNTFQKVGNKQTVQGKERKPQENQINAHDRRNNNKKKATTHRDIDSSSSSKLFVVEESANAKNNNKKTGKSTRRSYSYPPSSEYEESSSIISEDYSSSSSSSNLSSSPNSSSNEMHDRKHRRARVPSQVTYTQTFRQGNSEEFTSSMNPTTLLDANTLLNGSRNNNNTKNMNISNYRRSSNGGVYRRSYSLRPALSGSVEDRKLIYPNGSQSHVANKSASLSFPPPRPTYSLNQQQGQQQLIGYDSKYYNNNNNRIPASVSDGAVSFRSTPIRRTAIHVNDPLLFTPSETSVNVHYISNNINNNNNNNIANTINDRNNYNKPTNTPPYARSSVSALKSTSDALHSAQSTGPNNPLTSISQTRKGLLYSSLLPKTRASTPRTNIESNPLASQENVPTAVIPILPQPMADNAIITSSTSASIAKENTNNETGNRFTTPASASAANVAVPVQAQVPYVHYPNYNENKVSTYERVDEAEMHRMDHGRWKKYATPKPFSSLFKPHHHDPYNYHTHTKHTKRKEEKERKAFHSARSAPEPTVKVVSTRKNDTWHVTPQSTNNNSQNNQLRHEPLAPQQTACTSATPSNTNKYNEINNAVQPYNEPFNMNDSRDTSRVVKVVERHIQPIPHTQSSSSFLTASSQQEQQLPQQPQERELNKSKMQHVSTMSNKSLPSEHAKQPITQRQSAILSNTTYSLPTFVSSSYGVVGEGQTLQPLVWTSGSSACVMSRNHQIPKPPHVKNNKKHHHYYPSQMNTNNMETLSAPSSNVQGAALISDSRSDQQQKQQEKEIQSPPQMAVSLPAQPVSVLSLTSKNTNADATATMTSSSNTNGSTKAKSLQFEAKPVITSTPSKNSLYTQSYKERFHVQPLASETLN